MDDATTKPRSPKFKHTRALVRIALDDGMTQDEVARLCRTQQSVVSAWAGGKQKAREDVVKPLLARYGHRLNRATSRLYLVQAEPEVPWAETETGKLVARLIADPKGYARDVMTEDEWDALVHQAVRRRLRPEYVFVAEETAPDSASRMGGRRVAPVVKPEDGATVEAPRDERGHLTDEAFLPIVEEDLARAESRIDWSQCRPVRSCWERLCPAVTEGSFGTDRGVADSLQEEYRASHRRLVRVEGAPVWRHVVGVPKPVRRREGRDGERIEFVLEPTGRWVVHPAGSARFRLVVQHMRVLVGPDAAAWKKLTTVQSGIRHVECDGRVRSDDDVARWVCDVLGPFDLPELIARVEALLPGAGPHDRASAPFTLRKALVERGYDVPGVEFLPL